jgi:hypothetical protein
MPAEAVGQGIRIEDQNELLTSPTGQELFAITGSKSLKLENLKDWVIDGIASTYVAAADLNTAGNPPALNGSGRLPWSIMEPGSFEADDLSLGVGILDIGGAVTAANAEIVSFAFNGDTLYLKGSSPAPGDLSCDITVFNPETTDTIVITGAGAPVDARALVISGSGTANVAINSFTADTTLTLTVTSTGAPDKTSTLPIKFGDYVYTGSFADGVVQATTTWIPANMFAETLQEKPDGEYRWQSDTNEYSYIAIPASYNPKFYHEGIEGGFELTATHNLTNSAGYTEPYKVYRSLHPGLGDLYVDVVTV